MRSRHLPWLLVLGTSLVLAGGCGDDEGTPDGGPDDSAVDGGLDGSPDGTVTPDHCTDGVMSGDETAIDCGGSCAPCMLVVESTDPEDGTTGVYLDQVLRVVFSHELDTTVPEGALVVRNAAGDEITGRYIADRRTLVFTPARYDVDAAHTVTLRGAISAGAYSLADDYEFTFTTGDTTTSDSRPPPDSYDPLGRGAQIALGRRPEYMLLFSGAAEPRVALEDPPEAAGDATQLAQNSFGALLDDKLPVVGQFDDDGWDEVAVISRSAADVLAVAFLDRAPDGSLAATLPSISLALADTYDAAAGDFDLDGRDELFIAVAKAGEPIHYYLIDYDDGTGEYVVAETDRVTADGSQNAEYVKVAAGDVDADGKAEAIIVWHVHTTGEQSVPYYVIHDDLDAGLAEVFPARVVKDNMPWQVYAHYSFIDVATGDIDGDGADEILFGLYEPYWNSRNFWNTAQQVRVDGELRVVDNYDHAAPTAPAVVLPDGGAVTYSHFWYANAWVTGAALTRRHMSVLVTADIDGDGRDEVLMQNQLFKFEPGGGATTSGLELTSGWPHELPNTVVDYRARADVADWRPIDFSDGYLTRDVQVGDVDGDLKEDIVLLRKNGSSIWVDYFDAGVTPGSYDLKRTQLQQATNYFGFAGAPRLALPNVDDDSLIVEPAGHDIYLGDNVITAVLAAAPCSEDLGQDTGGCSTTFGQGTTASWTNGVYVNASAGIVVGTEWEPSIDIPFINIKLAKVEIEGSFGVEGSYQHTWAGSRSEQFAFTAGADNNLVVFETHVYDRYHYRVISHPNPDHIGTLMTLSVPSGSRLMAVSQDYYNANNGAQLDIGGGVLPIVPGDLSTYPNRTAANDLATATGNRLVAISSMAVPAPEGVSNSTEVELGVSTGEGDEFSVGLYLNASLKVCGPDAAGWTPNVCVGVEGSVSSGYAYSYEWSEDVVFAGGIAGLPTERYAEDGYAAGLVAYETTLHDPTTGENQNFVVVSYYIE